MLLGAVEREKPDAPTGIQHGEKENMKKEILFVLAVVLTVFPCTAQKEEVTINTDYDMPSFGDESAVLIDVNKIDGRFNSFICITNYSKYKEIAFEVFVHSPISSSWESLGKSSLPGFESKANYGKKNTNLKLYRYFAVVPMIDSKFDYQYKIEKKFGRLEISIFTKNANVDEQPLPYHDAQGVYVFIDKQIPNGAKKGIRLQNMTSSQIVSVVLYGWDKKNYKWVQLCGLSAQVGQKKPTNYKVFNKKLSFKKFKYLAIASPDGKKYNYQFQKKGNTWFIIVEDTLILEN